MADGRPAHHPGDFHAQILGRQIDAAQREDKEYSGKTGCQPGQRDRQSGMPEGIRAACPKRQDRAEHEKEQGGTRGHGDAARPEGGEPVNLRNSADEGKQTETCRHR